MSTLIPAVAIADALAEVLRTNEDLTDACRTIVAMEDPPHMLDQLPWVGVLPGQWTPAGANIMAGQHQRYRLAFEVWAVAFSIESARTAWVQTYDIITKAVNALLGTPRTLGGLVERWELGEVIPVPAERIETSFVTGAYLNVYVETSARL